MSQEPGCIVSPAALLVYSNSEGKRDFFPKDPTWGKSLVKKEKERKKRRLGARGSSRKGESEAYSFGRLADWI
jgi:hypothetical protein